MKQKLTARERKLLKRPKIRILSETPNEPNRKQKREALHMRTSSTLCTKKHTRGRLIQK